MGRKGDATKLSIREKSKELFAEKGYKGVTMKAVCERTGLSRGGLYQYYGSTQQIFQEVLSEALSRQEKELAKKQGSGVPAAQILEEILKQYMKGLDNIQDSFGAAVYEYYASQGETGVDAFYQQYKRSEDMWCSLVQYGVDQSEFRDVDAKTVFAFVLFAYYGARQYSRLLPFYADLPEKLADQIRQMLIIS